MSNAPAVTAVTGSQQARATVNSIRGVSALLYACQQGDVEKVHRILRAQPTAYLERDRTGKSALHYCCTSDRITSAQAADLLVMAAPDLVDGRDEEGFTPLHLAVIAGNLPLVTFLLANNADVNAVDNEKHTVVHWATVCAETVALRSVLAAGAPVSTPDVHGGYPLHYAAQMCGGEKDPSLGLQILHTLLSHEDISVTVEDGDGRPPLLWAASAGSAKAVLALIRAGTPVEAHDKDGLTALHCAASRGHTDCIDTLLTLCGASPDVIDSNGCTALHYAVTLGHADATALLLSHTADPNRQDRKGRSPAHCGCAKGQFETVKLLGAHGANLWLRNARGDLPLHEAAASGRRDLVRWLLEARPSQVNARNNDGRCPLHLAALNDNADMCKILIDAGAQINPILRTSKNIFMTPMDCALQRGFRSTAKYLQLHGGVPANRLTGVSQRPTASSAVSLHIRDDVTLWGGSSSEVEESEELRQRKTKKKVFKRKSAYKLEKRLDHASISDEESKITEKFPVADSAKIDENQNGDAKYTNVSQNHRGEILIYANEVNISDKLGAITIKQNSEFVVSENGEATKFITTNEEIRKSNSSDKRPKSAKYGRLKNATKKSNGDSPTIIQKDLIEITTEKDIKEIITEMVTNIDKGETEQSVSNNLKNELAIDRHSLKSNTSVEDSEDHKEVVVEVSVHTPPKDIQNNSISNDAKTDKPMPVTVTDTKADQTPAEQLTSETITEPPLDEKPSTKTELIATTNDTNNQKPENNKNENDQITSSKKVETQEGEDTDKPVESPSNKIDVTITSKKDPKEEQTQPEEEVTEKVQEKVNNKSGHKRVKQTSKKNPNAEQSSEDETFSSPSKTKEQHRSFKVLKDGEYAEYNNSPTRTPKSEEETHVQQNVTRDHEKLRRSKIPTPINLKKPLSKSDKFLERHAKEDYSGIDVRIPSLPNIYDHRDISGGHPRSISNLSAPFALTYSDNDVETGSDLEEISSATRKKKLRKRSKPRNAKSAGSDYESSNLIDSGFEPSPRSTRLPKSKYMTERGVNMTSVTQTIQTNIRRYHLERKIFQHLLDLKRLQIRSGQHNEAVLVKRAIDAYHRSCAATVGAGRYLSQDYTFKNFEKFLYNSLRKIQKNGHEHLRGLPETPKNPLHCTQSTHRCDHAIHAYTGVPCAAYLPKMNHHNIPKIGFDCKPSGFLPKILPKNAVTLELCHGSDKQVISLPAERLDQNKRYYVTFTVKGSENTTEEVGGKISSANHLHSKSD